MPNEALEQAVAIARPKLSAVVSSAMGRGEPSTLVQLARAAAANDIGPLQEGATEIERVLRNAAIEHKAALNLAGLVRRAPSAFLLHAWNIFDSQAYLAIRLPVIDKEGEMLKNEVGDFLTISFKEWDEWYNEIVSTRDIDSTIISTIRNCVKRLLPEVKAGRVKFPELDAETGQMVERVLTIDDVVSLERSKLEVIMGPLGKLLDQFALDQNPQHMQRIGHIIERAHTSTRAELKKFLSGEGLRGERLTQLDCYITILPSGRHIYTIVADEAGQHFLDGILSDRLNVVEVNHAEREVTLEIPIPD